VFDVGVNAVIDHDNAFGAVLPLRRRFVGAP
jgi:hypothetical protein